MEITDLSPSDKARLGARLAARLLRAYGREPMIATAARCVAERSEALEAAPAMNGAAALAFAAADRLREHELRSLRRYLLAWGGQLDPAYADRRAAACGLLDALFGASAAELDGPFDPRSRRAAVVLARATAEENRAALARLPEAGLFVEKLRNAEVHLANAARDAGNGVMAARAAARRLRDAERRWDDAVALLLQSLRVRGSTPSAQELLSMVEEEGSPHASHPRSD